MAKTPKAQYEKLIKISTINYETKALLDVVDIPKALSYSPEPPEVWAEMAREAAANLQALADKISPRREFGISFQKKIEAPRERFPEAVKLALKEIFPSAIGAPRKSHVEEQKQRAKQLKAEHPEWSMGRIARIVDPEGCQRHGVKKISDRISSAIRRDETIQT